MPYDIRENYGEAAEAAHRAGLFAEFRKLWESELLRAVVEKRRTERPTTIFVKVLTNRS